MSLFEHPNHRTTPHDAFHMTRDQLIKWLVWNDSNGTYRDEDCELAGFDLLTQITARDLVWKEIRDSQKRGTCEFCHTLGHDTLDCPNIDPEQRQREYDRREYGDAAFLEKGKMSSPTQTLLEQFLYSDSDYIGWALAILIALVVGGLQLWGSQPTRQPDFVCPFCQTKGKVYFGAVTRKTGISGGKATAAILTGGVSLLATGLSRKEYGRQARCRNCHRSYDA